MYLVSNAFRVRVTHHVKKSMLVLLLVVLNVTFIEFDVSVLAT